MSVTRVDQSKTVEVRIMVFSPYGSPIPLVLQGKFRPDILMGSPKWSVKQGRGGENRPFSSFKCQYLKKGRIYGQSYN